MKAKGNFVIVCRRSFKEEVLESGLIISSDPDKLMFFEGVVMSVGTYCKEDLGLAVGDHVLVRDRGGKIELGFNKPGKIFAVEDDDIICVLGEEDE